MIRSLLPHIRLDPHQYQDEFVVSSIDGWLEYQRIMGVCATGGGKSLITAELMERLRPFPCLFLADAEELVHQNAAEFEGHTGEIAGREQGDHHASLDDRVVVATSQSLFRRLSKYPRDYFQRIIVDECHRNTLGGMSQSIFEHFGDAKVLGVTATPFRADRKQLGDFYEKIVVNIPLDRLIREGYLSRVVIKSVPLGADIRGVRTEGGDFKLQDLDRAISPHLIKAANLLKEHARERKKIVAFLPLVKMAQDFAIACNDVGLPAVAVSGDDKSAIKHFTEGDARVICNASLLTTGWNFKPVDCVYILRPTKSLSLYSQMVGRGTRIYCPRGCKVRCEHEERKQDLLLLDPLFLSDDHKLVNPARLIASDDQRALDLTKKIAEMAQAGGGDGEVDLMDAESEVLAQREAALKKRIEEKAKKKGREVDAIAFALSLHEMSAAEYEPDLPWEAAPMTQKQKDQLIRRGFGLDGITCKGHAAKILDLIALRQERDLATPKQLMYLRRMGHPSPDTATFAEAGAWLDRRWARGKKAA